MLNSILRWDLSNRFGSFINLFSLCLLLQIVSFSSVFAEDIKIFESPTTVNAIEIRQSLGRILLNTPFSKSVEIRNNSNQSLTLGTNPSTTGLIAINENLNSTPSLPLCRMPLVLRPGEKCIIGLFVNGLTANVSDNLIFSYTKAGRSTRVNFSRLFSISVIPPARITASVTTVNFGSRPIGSPGTASLDLINATTQVATGLQISISPENSALTIQHNCSADQVAARISNTQLSKCTITISYSRASVNPISDTYLNISYQDVNEGLRQSLRPIQISGNAVPQLNSKVSFNYTINAARINGSVENLEAGKQLKLQFDQYDPVAISASSRSFSVQRPGDLETRSITVQIVEQPRGQFCVFSNNSFLSVISVNGAIVSDSLNINCDRGSSLTLTVSGFKPIDLSSVLFISSPKLPGAQFHESIYVRRNGQFSFPLKKDQDYTVELRANFNEPLQTCRFLGDNSSVVSGRATEENVELELRCVDNIIEVAASRFSTLLPPFLFSPVTILTDKGTFTSSGSIVPMGTRTIDNIGETMTQSVLVQPDNEICALTQTTPGVDGRVEELTRESLTSIARFARHVGSRHDFPVSLSCHPRAYMLGGTISGLTGSVRLSGKDKDNKSTNGPFNMTDKQLFYSEYDIGVVQQPRGQTCVVNNGKGRMPNSDLNNLEVICTAKMFDLTIPVTGLIGTVELRYGDTVKSVFSSLTGPGRIAQDTSLTFRVPHLSPVAISVVTHPENGFCEVENNGAINDLGQARMAIRCVPKVSISQSPPKGRQDLPYSYTPTVSIEGARFRLGANAPRWARIETLGSSTITGFPDEPRIYENITLDATVGGRNITVGTFTIEIDGDPLAEKSLHLNNVCQNSFSRNGCSLGFVNTCVGGRCGKFEFRQDMSFLSVLRGGLIPKPKDPLIPSFVRNTVRFPSLTGKGVRIALVGEGFERDHEDLRDNVLLETSVDYRSGSVSTPSRSTSPTNVAGIIAAVGWNNKGGRGVAPNSKIADLNAFSTELTAAESLAAAVNAYNTRDFDIVYSSKVDIDLQKKVKLQNPSAEIYQALRSSVEKGRGGLGTIHVVPAGVEDGGFKKIDTAYNPLTSIPFVIPVTSINMKGSNISGVPQVGQSSGAQRGASIWVAGMGGDFGLMPASNFVFPPGISSVSSETLFSPALLSTDVSGCDLGSSKHQDFSVNVFNFDSNQVPAGPNALNGNCNYTATTGIYDGATGTVTGAIALILEANPSLSWRDMKYILAKTAYLPPDPAARDLNAQVILSSGVNGAGLKYTNSLGFGRVNALEAVKLATENYLSPFANSALLSTVNNDGIWKYQSPELSIVIPAGATHESDGSGLNSYPAATHAIEISDNLIIEAVQISVSLDHPRIQDIGLLLEHSYTNSEGQNKVTKSTILTYGGVAPFEGSTVFSSMENQIFLSNAFYQEPSGGSWRIKVLNSTRGNRLAGLLKNWKINVYGRLPTQ